jgi:hypothetical protein
MNIWQMVISRISNCSGNKTSVLSGTCKFLGDLQMLIWSIHEQYTSTTYINSMIISHLRVLLAEGLILAVS